MHLRTSLMLTLCMLAMPSLVHGAPPEAADGLDSPQAMPSDPESAALQGESANQGEAEEPSPELEQARAIYERGVSAYSAGRYEAAVDAWLEAYNALPPNYETSKIRAELIYNIATAQKKAFDIDEDLAHLRQARASLQNFEDNIDEAYPEGLERDRERDHVLRVLEELDTQIADVQAAREAKERELAELARPGFDPVLDSRMAKQNRNLIAGGAVLTSVGAVGVATMAAGLAMGSSAEATVGELQLAADLEQRRTQIARGKTGNGLAVAGGIVGGVTLLAGVSMLAVGLSREKRRKAHRGDAGKAEVHVAPVFGSTGGGLRMSGRF